MEKTFDAAKKLREALHLIPEPSGQEVKTRTALMEYLKASSDLEIHDCGKWFYAAHREGENLPSIAFRADMDAVSGTDGLYHGCGHDGHCSVMASLGAWTSGKSFGKNIFFLFQHAVRHLAHQCFGKLPAEFDLPGHGVFGNTAGAAG